ncbi:MAG: class IV adenylate cyclase [Patescibacteria group bacterium]|nr:class IV adenylate cyclase [Patescibacteria group bacterium]
MPRNIEIKARAGDFAEQARMAAEMADGPAVFLQQEDTFFRVPGGRLKLREFADGTGELIQYERVDTAGPKQSDYVRTPIPEPASLKEVLARALGVRAVVRKTRTLLVTGQTRIHLDEVDGLGRFLELEVVLRPEQAETEGVAIAEQIMAQLGVKASDLTPGAYVDLLLDCEQQAPKRR